MKRFLSTGGIATKDVVDLAFRHVKPTSTAGKSGSDSQPVLINIHGIFGSSAMFRSLSGPLANHLNMDVYSIDLRNHGDSPQAFPYDFMTYAKDVINFIKTNLGPERPVNLLGFSIGGKIGLLTTLCHEINIQKCISIDLPPYETPNLDSVVLENYALIMKIVNREIKIERGSPGWKNVLLDHFRALPANKVNNGDPSLYFASGFFRVKENDIPHESDAIHHLTEDRYIDYYLPLKQFPDLLDMLRGWPDLHGTDNSQGLLQTSTPRPVLFMRGLQSCFIKDDYSLLRQFYPNAVVREFNTGHNMTVEEPKKTFQCIVDYLKA
ncbi:hypothetical protein HG537_0D04830 [Torulaspora globosa]|uniref:AB hydrolase-1 domain-containing protein n=1 Tax=Torulaspora globosa TaxID=48254 RepID=A0A7H9HTC5_9SACH|nr:hypothetical protein HG537_0D04830 [Torulaspora sp. CBS 2947]